MAAPDAHLLASAVYAGSVMHQRHSGPRHGFTYPLFMWLLDLAEIPTLSARIHGFGHNRFRPIAFHDRDHLAGTGEPLIDQLRSLVEGESLAWPGGPVRVLTHCRILGYVFNPVTFWYCYSRDARLAAVVAEVNNTFGERHCYVSGRDEWGGNGEVATEGRASWTAKKVFHVSPFLSLDGTYRFAVGAPATRVRVHIDLRVQGEQRLRAVLALRREPITAWSVAAVMARYPLMTARVIGAIHWEALHLWRKGARYHVKPPYDPEGARQGVA